MKAPIKPSEPTPPKRPLKEWNELTTSCLEISDGDKLLDILERVKKSHPFPKIKVEWETACFSFENCDDYDSMSVKFAITVSHKLTDEQYLVKLNKWELQNKVYQDKLAKYNKLIEEYEVKLKEYSAWKIKEIEAKEKAMLGKLKSKYEE